MSYFLRSFTGIIFGLFILQGAIAKSDEVTDESMFIDRELPLFELPVLIGGTEGAVFTQDSLKGQVSIIVFFASWCPYCRAEHPHIVELAGKKDVDFFGIAFKDREKKIENWFDTNENPYKLVALDKDGKSSKKWGLRGIPALFVIDKKAHIRYHFSGSIDNKQYNDIIYPLIKKLQSEEG